jgi:hypothetical protein
LANWKLNNNGQQLFLDTLKDIGWYSESYSELARLLKVDRATAKKLKDGEYQGHKSKLVSVLIQIGLDEDEVESDEFAEENFEEVKTPTKSQSDNKLESEVSQKEEIATNSNTNLFIQNPFVPRSGTINDPEYFFGREKEVYDVFEAINSGDCVELLGKQRQIGKSSVLIQIKNLAITKFRDKWEPAYLNLNTIHTESDFYESFCDELKISACTGNDLKRQLKKRQNRILLLLDETENLTEKGFTREVRQSLRGFADEGYLIYVVAVFTPLKEMFEDSHEQGKTSPFQGRCTTTVEINPWNEKTVQRFVETRLENTGINFSRADVEKLWRESQGHPQKLMQACFYLYRQYLENL